jgi:hypothetical protein
MPETLATDNNTYMKEQQQTTPHQTLKLNRNPKEKRKIEWTKENKFGFFLGIKEHGQWSKSYT